MLGAATAIHIDYGPALANDFAEQPSASRELHDLK
jgi:hypothetical protein